MSDADFVCERDVLEVIAEVHQTEVVSGIQSQSTLTCLIGCCDKRTYSGLWVPLVIGGIGLCVQLYAVGSDPCSIFDHLWVGIYEDGHTDVFLLELCHDVSQQFEVHLGVPPVIRSNLSWCVWNQCYLGRAYFFHQIDKATLRIALDVELCLQDGFQVSHILISDVTFVRTWMYSDSVCSE